MESTYNTQQSLDLFDNVAKMAYLAFQNGKGLFGLAHKNLSNRVTQMFAPEWGKGTEALPQEYLLKLQKQREELIELDWQDGEKGIYPVSLLFENYWDEFFRYYPFVWLDLPENWQKITQKKAQEFDPKIDTRGYPRYYLQNFHYQTNGYLSEMSANLYDLQVEILFNGTADPMRRRILKLLKTGLAEFKSTLPQHIKVLDVACGTGRTLRMIRATLPQASLYGTDLSPAYLRKANQSLSQLPGELPQLLQANAEELPYQDNYFHGITSVFLFHELPPQARQNVINECFRVIQPGGVFIICDSIQLMDSPELKVSMDNFPLMFHEPYYHNYINDDLVTRLEQAGFNNIFVHNCFMSKYWVAYKAK